MVNFDFEQFVATHTAVAAPALVPELTLRLAGRLGPLWEALEREAGGGPALPPYWAFAWPGGQALARYLLDHPATARGKRVLDFGGGGGVAALAALRSGAARAVTADLDPRAAATARMNAELNGLALETASGDALLADWAGVDLVLAGDVFYERPLAALAEPWLRAFAARGATVLVGDPDRRFLPPGGLAALAEYEIATDVDLEDRASRRTRVLRMAGPPELAPEPAPAAGTGK